MRVRRGVHAEVRVPWCGACAVARRRLCAAWDACGVRTRCVVCVEACCVVCVCVRRFVFFVRAFRSVGCVQRVPWPFGGISWRGVHAGLRVSWRGIRVMRVMRVIGVGVYR
jgi:hypothetical protein